MSAETVGIILVALTAAIVVVCVAGAIAQIAASLFHTLRAWQRRTAFLYEDGLGRTPLERAREAIQELSPGDREHLRCWLELRWPSGRRQDHREGIMT
jgi:hypothetical protein